MERGLQMHIPIINPKVISLICGPLLYIVNVTGETMVPNKNFPSLMLGKSLLYAGINSIFTSLPASCWENPCFMLGQTLFSRLF